MKHMLARLIPILLALACAVTLASCSDEDKTMETESTSHATEAVTNPATDPATEAMTDPVTDPVTDPATEPATDPATDPATEPATDPATEPATEPAETVDEAAVKVGVPTPDGELTPVTVDQLTLGLNGSIQVTDIGDGVLRVENHATDYSPAARLLSFSNSLSAVADAKDDIYAYVTVAYFIPDNYRGNKDLWVEETAYLYFSMGTEYSAYKAVPATAAGGNKLAASIGSWNVFEIPVADLRGDSFGILTEKNSTIYIANIGVVHKGNPEHDAVKASMPALPENFHPIDVCEYDENGKEIKRNMFPGNAAGSIDPVILDEEHELVQVYNYAGDTSYESRSFRFMDDPIKAYRGVEGAILSFDIWMPAQYGSEPTWNIDDKAAMYFSIGSNFTAVTVNIEEYAADGDLALKLGGWTHVEILVSDLKGGGFGFYTQGGTYFYYCNFGVVLPS